MKEKKRSTFTVAKRIFAALVVLFLLLLGGRFLYNLFAPERTYSNGFALLDYDSMGLSNNIATNRIIASNAPEAAMDQKYERVANLSSKSLAFEDDLAQARAALEENRGIVQAENSYGLPGSRSVALTVGVRPEAFEPLRSALEGVGELTDTNVSTTDKTSAYRQLLAEKESLERRMARYEQLKKHEGSSLQDQLALEAEIVQVDSELRAKLVELGEFGDEQGLSTIHFTLYEGSRVRVAAEFTRALTWSAVTTACVAGLLLLMALASIVAAMAWKRIRGLKDEG